MKTKLWFLILISCIYFNMGYSIQKPDTITAKHGKIILHFLGHGSLYIEYNNEFIYIDPFSKVADYATLPKADLILVTHDHYDHFDVEAINKVLKEKSIVVFPPVCKNTGKYTGAAEVMENGDKKTFMNINVDAVPAYNILNKRPDGNPFHPKGQGNGYVLTIDNTKIYIAGDTENIPEMGDLKNIDIAFLPMNLPYTMTPEMVADAVTKFKPKILYPYHFGDTDVNKLKELMVNSKTEIRIRDMK